MTVNRANLRSAATATAFAALAAMALVQFNRSSRYQGDLGGYLVAGRALLEGGYDTDAWQNAWPPFFSLLVAPLVGLTALLPEPRVYLSVIYFGNLGIAVALIAICARGAAPFRRPALWVYAATGLAAAPY